MRQHWEGLQCCASTWIEASGEERLLGPVLGPRRDAFNKWSDEVHPKSGMTAPLRLPCTATALLDHYLDSTHRVYDTVKCSVFPILRKSSHATRPPPLSKITGM